MRNALPATRLTRQPRGAVKLYIGDPFACTEGMLVPGWGSFEVDTNAYRSADTFRVVFVVSQLPPERNVAWFAAQQSIAVEIFASETPANPDNYAPAPADRLIYGMADEIHYDPVGGTVELTGRDLTALLIDTKASEHFANQTSSQIATTLANRHGLTPVVTTTTAKAGDFYKDDHASTTQEQSEWDLLAYLADIEGFQVYVRGQELHFEPKPDSAADPYVIEWTAPNSESWHPASNAITLSFSRALTVARGVTVEVHSWNAKKKKGFSAFWPTSSKGAAPGQSSAKAQVHRFTFAGLTQDKAIQRAKALYEQIIAHEMNLTAYLPGDSLLTCETPVQVRGTGSQFDQLYYPDNVSRTLSADEGYRMNVRAKSAHPDLESVS